MTRSVYGSHSGFDSQLPQQTQHDVHALQEAHLRIAELTMQLDAIQGAVCNGVTHTEANRYVPYARVPIPNDVPTAQPCLMYPTMPQLPVAMSAVGGYNAGMPTAVPLGHGFDCSWPAAMSSPPYAAAGCLPFARPCPQPVRKADFASAPLDAGAIVPVEQQNDREFESVRAAVCAVAALLTNASHNHIVEVDCHQNEGDVVDNLVVDMAIDANADVAVSTCAADRYKAYTAIPQSPSEEHDTDASPICKAQTSDVTDGSFLGTRNWSV